LRIDLELREDVIHYSVREFLRESGWKLIAGQYPDGSDDELVPLNVVDPTLARDQSPDHRRHSKNKLVPDLVACHENVMVVVEMKTLYSAEDEAKLLRLLGDRFEDFANALRRFVSLRRIALPGDLDSMAYVPCLAFTATASYPRRPDFGYFLVSEPMAVIFEGTELVPSIPPTSFES
jgi:hypothetical protein